MRIGRYVVPLGGDSIVAADGHPIESMADLIVHLEEESGIGGEVRLTVVRGATSYAAHVRVGEKPDST